MGTEKHITLLHAEADSIRDLVKTRNDGCKDYDQAGRLLVGLLNLFGTGMTGVEMESKTIDVFNGIADRLVKEDLETIAKDRKRKGLWRK